VNGLRFYTDSPQQVEVRVTRCASSAENGVECVLSGPFYNRHGRLIDPHRVYLKGRTELSGAAQAVELPVPATPSLKLPQQWHEMAYLDAERAAEESLVFHGPALRCLKRIMLDADGGWGQILAPPLSELSGQRSAGWMLPAAALDACLVACAVYARQILGVRQLPRTFGLLVPGRLPHANELCTVQFHYRGRSKGNTHFDFNLFGEDGAVLVGVENHGAGIVGEVAAPVSVAKVTELPYSAADAATIVAAVARGKKH
jgi:hypothetical protein